MGGLRICIRFIRKERSNYNMIIPVATVGKIMKVGSRTQGVTRISEKAVEVLVKNLEKKAEDITKQAVELAKHAGRDTVKEEDIRLSIIK